MLIAALLLQAATVDAPPTKEVQEVVPASIAWYSDLAQAKADAKRLNRPIFLMAAAPQCHGVAGMW